MALCKNMSLFAYGFHVYFSFVIPFTVRGLWQITFLSGVCVTHVCSLHLCVREREHPCTTALMLESWDSLGYQSSSCTLFRTGSLLLSAAYARLVSTQTSKDSPASTSCLPAEANVSFPTWNLDGNTRITSLLG